MSSERHGGTRWPGRWTAPPAKGRTPTPLPEVVAAAPLLAALWAALDGQRPPCASDPTTWTSSHPDDLLVAQEGCSDCPARQQCSAYADAIDATCGTWAGRDRTPGETRRRRTNTHHNEMERSA